VERLSGGQLNTALRVNREYVLRCREAARSTGSLRREALLLQRMAGKVPVPEVIAAGLDDLLGEYSLQRCAPGQNLLRAWLENPDGATREWWLLQWTNTLRAIHEERYAAPGEFMATGELREATSWRSYIEGRVRKRVDRMMRVPSIDREFVLHAEKYLRRHAGVLEDGLCCLIHRDLHFANVLVDGPHLTAILDWELAEVGPPDYELDTIYRFLRNPSYYAEPEFASSVTPTRFASVWIRLRRGYPELFAARHLRERLALYALDHALSSLLQLYNSRTPHTQSMVAAREETLLRQVGEIIQGRYGPE
jgi:aminoglycoside phosphotransferase (APT) family kinase protein